MIDNILDNDYQSCGCDCAASSGGTPPEFIYMMIPGEWACVYVKLLAAVADFGEQMLKDCQASCKDNSKNIINCWNMFSSAIAAHQLGQDKLAETLIKYIDAQLKVIYRDSRCAEFSTMALLPISEDGQKAMVGCKTDENKAKFWLGAGTSYLDIMNSAHEIPIKSNMRGAYDISVSEGDYIILVIYESLRKYFIRADMNGFEIPFSESTISIGDYTYSVFISENTYEAGTYNIDING